MVESELSNISIFITYFHLKYAFLVKVKLQIAVCFVYNKYL